MSSSRNHILSNPSDYSDFDTQWNDLVWGLRAGHMGAESCKGIAFADWHKYTTEDKDYYCTRAEKQAIAKGGSLAASKLQGRAITLVARGAGSKFKEKDASLAREFEKAGCTIVGVVHIDSSFEALKSSSEAGKEEFPNAWHCPLLSDFYDPNLKYPVIGTEVNTLLGFTMENVEGFPKDGPPRGRYIEHLSNMRMQMSSGAHLITTVDTNQDKEQIERSYSGKARYGFASGMLRENDLDHLPFVFVGEYFPDSYIFVHNYEATQDTSVPTITGTKYIKAGTRLPYNNSLKLPLDIKLEWEREAGFICLDQPKDIAFDDDANVALLHFQNS